jgi:hypothetical protein
MSAFASSRMALAAASPYAAGRTTVGGAGQGGSRHLGQALMGISGGFATQPRS